MCKSLNVKENKMPASIGVNLRVTGHCSQGGRKYMEDLFSVAYQQTEDERDLEYAFFGIYDGHGGSEAAAFAKEHLMDSIVKQRHFWSDNDEDVLKAIRNGYMLTHMNMWKELEKWPKTVTGLPSTAGTTASIAFIRRGKIYIGHVGDSAIVLGYQKEGCDEWCARPLTSEHKPEAHGEMERIERCGGKVVAKAGVPRVVWSRPRPPPHGPHQPAVDEIPFLAVARSLGDLWSYNVHRDEFIVSPDPDVGVLPIDPSKFRCLIFGTDGLWNMLSAESAVRLVQATERHNEAALVAGPDPPRHWLNPSKSLVDHALERWSNTRMRADNTSVVTLMLDPPGPPRAAVLRARSTQRPPCAASPTPHPPVAPAPVAAPAPALDPPQNGLTIMTRYSDADRAPAPAQPQSSPLPPCATLDGRYSLGSRDDALTDADASVPGATTTTTATILADRGLAFINYGNPAESSFMTRLLHRTRLVNTLGHVYEELVNTPEPLAHTDVDAPLGPPLSVEQAPVSPARTDASSATDEREGSMDALFPDDSRIQINEVSSSSPTDGPPRPRARRHHPAPSARVLRSQDVELHPIRPHTRRAAARVKPPDPTPPVQPTQPTQPTLERVVILNRARGVPVAPAVLRVSVPVEARTASRRTQHELPQAPAPAQPPSSETGRITRSKESVSLPLTQKITRSISNVARELRGHSQSTTLSSGPIPVTSRPGNSVRAPGPARRPAPGPRTQKVHLTQPHPRAECSKENFGAARRRRAGARARGLLGLAAAHTGPASNDHNETSRPTRPARRVPADDDGSVEVHSTTDDHTTASSCGGESKVATVAHPRALRSRNDAEPSVPSTASRRELSKRPPPPVPAPIPAAKSAKLGTPYVAAERCTRALTKRASGPWAPALALRNRLRKRLAK